MKKQIKELAFTALFMAALIILYFSWEVFLASKGIIE